MRTLGIFFSICAASGASLYQASFQGESLPQGWAVVQGKAQVDRKVLREGKASLRIEPDGQSAALIRSAPLKLTPGKRYEVSGWLRTDGLSVRELDRTPVAMGLSLSMRSLPFDTHSASLAGTTPWKRVSLKFTAPRTDDRIEVRIAEGAAFDGKAYVEGISVDEVSEEGAWPVKAAVTTFGPAYRYPTGGWIYLHIEGEPYERGYQHGYLLAREIEGYLDRTAAELDSKDRARGLNFGRTAANALFLRGFDEEMLQEMKGIADGAAANNAKYNGRTVDLLDVVVMNTVTELGLLEPATNVLPTGIEGLGLRAPDYAKSAEKVPVTDRCSAFAATGKATRDGKMIVGHVTWWSLTLAEQTNILLDVKPTQGHRVIMQSYPAGIQSGTDYYQNDAGVILTETTIRQSPFNAAGTPVAFRARKAIQYGTNVDLVVKHLAERNNGLYTNEWLIGDAKNDEVAMYELGTRKTRLWRSTKNEWFGGTEGFYWGCNNAKDLDVRTEYFPDPKGRPAHIPFVAGDRDLKWVELYDKYKGDIDEHFGFTAFRTAPLVASATSDAKIAGSEMARNFMMWAYMGKPNEREWQPSEWSKKEYDKNNGLYPGGYRLISGTASDRLKVLVQANEAERRSADKKKDDSSTPKPVSVDAEKLWKGWLIAGSDADAWVTAGSAGYARFLRDTKDLEKDIEAWRVRTRSALREWDKPLRSYQTDVRAKGSGETLMAKSALVFDALRREMGDDKFYTFMSAFYADHSTQKVTGSEFISSAEKAAGKSLSEFFARWLDQTGIPGDSGGATYLLSSLSQRLPGTIIVYGTVAEAGTNRFAAEQLQHSWLDWYESEIPIRKDFEVTAEELAGHNVVFIGRPETNSALADWATKLGATFDGASFTFEGKPHASEYEALAQAFEHPQDPKKMVVVLAGNSPLETVRLVRQIPMDRKVAVVRTGKL